MANNGRPERERRAETDGSVFALEDSVDEIWLQAEQAMRAMEVLPDLRTHRLDLKIGKKKVALFPEKHQIPLPDGAVAEVKWNEGMGCWFLAEIKKTKGNERFAVQTKGYGGFSISIEPVDGNYFWLGNIIWYLRAEVVKLDAQRLPFGEAVDAQLLGGFFQLKVEGENVEFSSVYAGDIFDPIQYQLDLKRSDPLCRHLCEPMVRLLGQVFGKKTEYAV